MNILHIDTEKTWRGGENQMRLLIEGLRDSHQVKCHLALQPQGEAYKRLQGDFSCLPVAMSGGFDLRAVFKIISYCRKHKIQLIDAQTSNAHSLGLLVKSVLPYVKLVVHRRVDFPLKTSWINQSKYRSDRIDQYVAISGAIGQILRDYGINEDRVEVIPSAVSSEPYQQLNRSEEKQSLCQTLNLDQSLPLIGNASAMTDQKGYEVLLEAIAHLKKKKLKFNCVIAGDGHLRDKLEQMRMDLEIDDCVSFLGWIKEVPQFLSALDILTMPSNYEGLGTLILDGTYAGCAVVATEVGGIPEMIKHEETGMLSPVRNSHALAKNIEIMLKHPHLWQRYQQAAKEHIDKHFSLNHMVGGNLQVYQRLLQQG